MSAQSALATTSVERAGVLRVLGGIGAAAGVLFAAMTVWEHAGGGGNPVNQGGFLIAMAGYVALALGLHMARPGGDRRAARVFPILLAAAWTALIAGAALDALTTIDPDANLLNPLGGLLQAVGLAGIGVTTAAARRWSGWRRFWPLGLAWYYLGVLFVPAFAGIEPNGVTESIWALGYTGLGVALFVEASGERSRGRGIAALVGVAVATAGVVLTAVLTAPHSTARPAPASVPVVDDGRSGGPDVYEHRTSGPVYGSADSLERQAGSGS